MAKGYWIARVDVADPVERSADVDPSRVRDHRRDPAVDADGISGAERAPLESVPPRDASLPFKTLTGLKPDK